MVDNYQRLEAWLESQIDWSELNREVSTLEGGRDKLFGKIRQSLLNVYNKEVEEGMDKGDLVGLYDYAQRRVVPDTKREKSMFRLIEDRIKWFDPYSREEFVGKDIFRRFEDIDKREGAIRKAKIEQESAIRREEREEQRLKEESRTLFPEYLKQINDIVDDATLSNSDKGKRITLIRTKATKEKALFPENIRRIVQLEVQHKEEMGLKGSAGASKDIVRRAETPLVNELIEVQNKIDNRYLNDLERAERHHIHILRPNGKLNLWFVKRKDLNNMGIFPGEIDDALRLYQKKGGAIQRQAERIAEERGEVFFPKRIVEIKRPKRITTLTGPTMRI